MTKSKLAIFKNDKVGQPVIRNDGSIVEFNGEPMIHCDLNGKINLPEGLPAGDYTISIYKQKAKTGLNYYAGTIKPAWKKKEEIDQHSVDKGNGYAPKEKSINLNDIDENGNFDLNDDCPF